MTSATGGDIKHLLDEIGLCAKAADTPREQIRELADFAETRGESLLEVLLDRGVVEEQPLAERLASLLHIPYLAEEIEEIPESILSQMSPALAGKYEVVPINEDEGRLVVACWNPFEWERWDELQHILAVPIVRSLSSRGIVRSMIKENYGLGADTIEHLVSERSDSAGQDDDWEDGGPGEEGEANEPTVINLVYQLLVDGIKAGATDIHFEPSDNRYRVRYRVDGMLEDVAVPASLNILKQAVVSRIKIMSGLDISEKRLPQDGGALISHRGHDYDLRISVLPGVYGEAVVIRVQNRDLIKLDLSDLGFKPEEQLKMGKLIERPHGLILVTGPTGSGKTTTLYTCLKKISRPETKIITIEDPVEYWMEDILQMQVNEAADFTFARALRSMLRHDPDVMLVGEIRDRETADIAIRSALTGHLVFATLHTNDAASAVTRLCDIGIEPFLVSSSIIGVFAQRLLRKICPHCRTETDIESLGEYEREILNRSDHGEVAQLWHGQGCAKCRFTGYSGRLAIGEVLINSSRIRQLIQARESADAVRDVAAEDGTRFLKDTALIAAIAGETSMSEVMRVTQEDI